MIAPRTDTRSSHTSRVALLAILALLAGALLLGPAVALAQASTLYIQTPADGGSDETSSHTPNLCTAEAEPCAMILHAVAAAAAGDTISVGPGTFDEETSIEIDKALTIEGSSGESPTTIGGDADKTLIVIEAGGDATLAHLTVEDQNADSTAVRNEGETRILDSTVAGNTFGVYNYGAATTTIEDSTLAGNAEFGVENDGGTAKIADSTVAGGMPGEFEIEKAKSSIAGASGASIAAVEPLTTGQSSPVGVINDNGGTTTIADSTITGLETGVYSQGGETAIIASTISENRAYGIQSENGSVTLAASVLADENSKSPAPPDCSAAVLDGGYNVASDDSCGLSASTSVSGSFAIDLEPLGENGGLSATEPPAPDSVLVERIPAAATATIDGSTVALCEYTSDQRGVRRPAIVGGSCDIGAVELGKATTTLSATPASPALGVPVTLTATVNSGLSLMKLGVPAPEGSVSFALEGGATIAGCEAVALSPIAGVPQATCTTETLPAGSDRLSAVYEPSAAYHRGDATLTVDVTQATPATLHVSSTGNDANPCTETEPCKTISHAVTLAAAGDTISVGEGEFPDEEIIIRKSLTITGTSSFDIKNKQPAFATGGDVAMVSRGLSSAIKPYNPPATTVSGEPDKTLIVVAPGVDVTLALLNVKDASTSGSTGVKNEGDTTITKSDIVGNEYGVYSPEGSLTITGSDVCDNAKDGVYNNSLIGALSITESDICDNADYGVYNEQGGNEQGAAVTITSSDLAGNGDGVYNEFGTATLTDSTLSANTTAGVYSVEANTTLTDSTVAGNADAGVYAEGGTAAILASTITENGEFEVQSGAGASVTLAASVLEGNSKENCGGLIDGGYNVNSGGACHLTAPSSVSDSPDIDLGPLQENGGPTETEPPAPASVVVDKIPAAAETTIAGEPVQLCKGTDQRGIPRPSSPGGDCDIGAVELAGSVTTLSASPASTAPGQPVTLTATVAAAPGTPSSLASPEEAEGSVSFALEGGAPIGGCETVALTTLAGAQQATCTTTTLPAGTDTLVATYKPSSYYNPSAATATVTLTAGSTPGSPSPGSPSTNGPGSGENGSGGSSSGSGNSGSGGSGGSGSGSSDSGGSSSGSGNSGSGGSGGSGSGSSDSGGDGSGGPPAGNGGTSSVLAAELSGLRVSPAVFTATAGGPSATAAATPNTPAHDAKRQKPKSGATVSFTLDQPATVLFEVTQRLPGRTAGGGRCVAQTHANRHARSCTRTVTLTGNFTRAAAKGANSFHFSGRLNGHKLNPGSYTLLASPSADGHGGQQHSIAFKIIR